MKIEKKIIIILFFLSSCYDTTLFVPKSRKKTTVATVIKPNIQVVYGLPYDSLNFSAMGKKYAAYCNPVIPGIVEDEKFMVWYDTFDPLHNEVIRKSPVFLQGEKTSYTTGEISQCFGTAQTIDFTYYVRGKKYEKRQYLAKQVRYSPSLKKGLKYAVEYWIENPQRSIIHLGKPVIDSLINTK